MVVPVRGVHQLAVLQPQQQRGVFILKKNSAEKTRLHMKRVVCGCVWGGEMATCILTHTHTPTLRTRKNPFAVSGQLLLSDHFFCVCPV